MNITPNDDNNAGEGIVQSGNNPHKQKYVQDKTLCSNSENIPFLWEPHLLT
jgi:hypothetical protein